MVRYVHQNEVVELPPPPSAPKHTASAVYADVGHCQLNASEGIVMGSLYDQVSETRRLPPPPPFPTIESTAEPLYEGLSQYSGDADLEANNCHDTVHADYEGLRQCSASGDIVVEANPCHDTVDADYEGLSQYSASGDVVAEANPCCDTVDY